MRTKIIVRCLLDTTYLTAARKVQSSGVRQIGLRWIRTDRSKRLDEKDMGWPRALWNKLFGKYLLTTNIVSSGVLMMIGDIMSQEIEVRRGLTERWDWSRIGRMFAVGSLQGPLHHYFYKWMDDAMPNVTVKTTTYKILLDQFIMSPVCILLFFYPACWLENKTLAEANHEVITKFPTVYMADWLVWPVTQFINFQYLHPKYRVIYVNVITMLYNIFLSYMKHNNSPNPIAIERLTTSNVSPKDL